MDLLGSILNSMDKPPALPDKQKLLIKKQKEEFLKRQQQEKEALNKLREKAIAKLNAFAHDPNAKKYEFPPMEKIQRTIVHEVAEVAGVAAFSIGEEEIDRRIIVYKKECTPSEDELNALRRGEEWNEEKAKLLAQQRELEKKQQEEDALQATKRKKEKFVPASNYKDKYSHLIGTLSALEGAQKTETNQQYGFVPAANKKDQRSIEQTLADIQTKKRLKTSHNTQLDSENKST